MDDRIDISMLKSAYFFLPVLEKFCGISAAHLDGICYSEYSKEKLYYSFSIPKKNGKKREIDAPCETLKLLQRECLKVFFDSFPLHEQLFAYIEKRSPLKNANRHIIRYVDSCGIKRERVPRWTLKIDLKDAFPSITSGLLRLIFAKMFHEKKELIEALRTHTPKDGNDIETINTFIDLIVWLVTYKGRLTQGAPTSPGLMNIVWTYSNLLDRIEYLCTKRNHAFTITVFCDDIIISSAKSRISNSFIKKIIRTIESFKWFKVNREKTTLTKMSRRCHTITGIVLTRVGKGNYPKTTLPKKKIKTYRGKIWRAAQILKSGRYPAKEDDDLTINQVLGYINWIESVCGETPPSAVIRTINIFKEVLKTF